MMMCLWKVLWNILGWKASIIPLGWLRYMLANDKAGMQGLPLSSQSPYFLDPGLERSLLKWNQQVYSWCCSNWWHRSRSHYERGLQNGHSALRLQYSVNKYLLPGCLFCLVVSSWQFQDLKAKFILSQL